MLTTLPVQVVCSSSQLFTIALRGAVTLKRFAICKTRNGKAVRDVMAPQTQKSEKIQMSTATNPLPVREVSHEGSSSSVEMPKETLQTFKHTMTAMRSHYKTIGAAGQAPHPYAIPASLLHPMNAQGMMVHLPQAHPDVKAQVQALVNDTKTSTTNEVNSAHQAVSQALNKLNSNKDLDAFHKALEQQRTSLKQKADDAIDKAIDAAEKIGDAHPDVISGLVSAVKKIGDFFSSMATSIYNFFANLVNTIAKAIKAAVEWLVNAGKQVAGWASGVVSTLSSVGAAIMSLF